MRMYFDVTIEQTGPQEWTVKVCCDQCSGLTFEKKVGSDPDAANFVRACTMEIIDSVCSKGEPA